MRGTDPSSLDLSGPEPPGERPFSGQAMRRLGDAILAGGQLEDENLQTYVRYVRYYGHLTQYLQAQMVHLLAQARFPVDADVTARPKSWPTTIDKLAAGARLDRIRDLAGVRITVLHGGRSEQDEVVEIMRAAYPEAKVIDRRRDPRHGYRAVHLEVRVNGCLAEIQVRTPLQHEWAEISERAADKWGRGLRYGQTPPDFGAERQHAWLAIQRLADVIDRCERVAPTVATLGFAGWLRLALFFSPSSALKVRRMDKDIQRLLALIREVTEVVD